MTPFPPIDRTSASFKSDLDAMFLSRLPNLINELNALQGNLNSLAAGGAYALIYRNVNNVVSNGSPNGGILAIASTQILVDTKDATGMAVGSILEDFNSSTSLVKGTIRIQKVGDPTIWATFNATLYARNGGGFYGAIDCRITASSNGAQFGENALVMLFFQRTGDKGDLGPIQTVPYMRVSDRKATGAHGGSAGGTGTFAIDRTFNTVNINTIPGASLSNNQVILQNSGVYEFRGMAPATVAFSKAGLFDVSGNGYIEWGTPANSAGSSNQWSFCSGRFTISNSSKVLTLRHSFYIPSSNNQSDLGFASAFSGQSEVYSSLEFWKVA